MKVSIVSKIKYASDTLRNLENLELEGPIEGPMLRARYLGEWCQLDLINYRPSFRVNRTDIGGRSRRIASGPLRC